MAKTSKGPKLLAKLKSGWAWLVAAVVAVLGVFAYGRYREEKGRERAELARKKKRLDRQIQAHQEALEKIDGRDHDLERKLKGLRSEREALHDEVAEQLEESARRKEEVKHLPPDEKADRVNELLGLGVVLALLLPAAVLGQQTAGVHVVEEGDTIATALPSSLSRIQAAAPAVAETTFYVFGPAAFDRLAERLEKARGDSIARAALERDTANLVRQVATLETRLDLCGQRVDSWRGVVEAERAVRETLEEMQPSGLEAFLFEGPSGFVAGNMTGLGLGVLACRGAN